MAQKKEAAEPEDMRSATDEELDVTFEGPAIATNRVFVNISGDGVRIAFAEQRKDKTPIFRTAVMLSPTTAISFKDVLVSTLKNIEAQIETAKASQADSQKQIDG